MLTVKVICVGKLKEKYYIDACAEYIKRLSPLCRFELCELRELSEPQKLEREGALIREETLQNASTVALCVEGKSLSSEDFAAWISNEALAGKSRINFIIGSSNGIDGDIKESASLRLSFSKMTFPHHLARVMLLEQIYRAFSINGGGKYHK